MAKWGNAYSVPTREREQFPNKGILKPSCDQNTERIQPPKKRTEAQANIMRTVKANKIKQLRIQNQDRNE